MQLRAGIITQARMTSTRLPGKILLEVGNKPLLKYHIDRLRKSELPIFIATTTNDFDNSVITFSRYEKIPFCRGSEHHVLSRYYECAKENELDIIVRVTSDCPLIDGLLIKQAVSRYMAEGEYNVYMSNCLQRTFPRGFDFEIFSFSMLEEAYHNARSEAEVEHVTPYLYQNKSGEIKIKHVLNESDKSNIRITVDTQDDFLLIKKLIEEYHADDLGYKGIIDLFNLYPELKAINAHINQKKI
jgi:spore coat polysaccharide biosynthesis protein SpsF